jgi:hypothetical protein
LPSCSGEFISPSSLFRRWGLQFILSLEGPPR